MDYQTKFIDLGEMTTVWTTVLCDINAQRTTRYVISPHPPDFKDDATPERKEWSYLRNKRPKIRHPEVNSKRQL